MPEEAAPSPPRGDGNEVPGSPVRGAAGAVPLAEVVPSPRGGTALLGESEPACEPGPSDRAAGEEPECAGLPPPAWLGEPVCVGAGLVSPARVGVLSLACEGELSPARVGVLSPACDGELSPPRTGEGLLSPA
jgi:hypothetical protein